MSADTPSRVSIIIPNWNGAQHLPVCLDSLRRQTYPDVEVIVVDNASQDASLSILERYPEVRVLAQTTNLGFTGACNAGLRAAGGGIRTLLNNDTETHPEWISAVVKTFDDHPEAGMVASKMLLFDRRDTLHTAGDYVTPDGLAHNRGVWTKDLGQFAHRAYVFSAC
ncbi:MAG: glycosyltransferase family 2 protein, partial [Anaerolineae bacterium]|nr:glycosyltransferase family 2 protein [Anaerolineae bacterium]